MSIRDSSKVNQKRFNNVNHYGRIPLSVLGDHSLTAEARIVYAGLAAAAFQGNVSYIGQRFLGELIGMSQATISRKLDELEKCGHIKQFEDGRGRRSYWSLESPVFAKKQRAGAQEVVSAPSGGRRLASVRREVA